MGESRASGHHLLCYWSAQTLGCGSPGAYRLQVRPDGGPTSAQSVAYGSVKAAILHGFREPSRSELASTSPLGLKATSITASAPLPRYGARGGRVVPTCLPVSGSHNPTSPPRAPALAGSLPAGLKAALCACPEAAKRSPPAGRPVSGFHNRADPSRPTMASRLPSGLNVTSRTPAR